MHMNCLIVCLSFFSIAKINSFISREKENLILIPSVAFRNHSNNLILTNQGWFYEENYIQAKILEKSLEKILNRNLDFDRINLFTGNGIEKQNVCIDGLSRSICTKTDDHGRIDNSFQITNSELKQLIGTQNQTRKVLYQLSLPNRNRRFTNEIYLCDDEGYTFISDIDDTIKITGVTSTIDTLINTFTGEFQVVQGMPAIYRYWQEKYQATFAYLTSSPDQLYPFLREFMDRERFPIGSFHMRHFTWFDQDFLSFFFSDNYVVKKLNTIEMFLKNTLNRKLILIGDIFQKDPNIYANITMKYPNRIGKIFIRKYQNDTEGQSKLEQVFKRIPRSKWMTFETGYDLPKEISVN